MPERERRISELEERLDRKEHNDLVHIQQRIERLESGERENLREAGLVAGGLIGGCLFAFAGIITGNWFFSLAGVVIVVMTIVHIL